MKTPGRSSYIAQASVTPWRAATAFDFGDSFWCKKIDKTTRMAVEKIALPILERTTAEVTQIDDQAEQGLAVLQRFLRCRFRALRPMDGGR